MWIETKRNNIDSAYLFNRTGTTIYQGANYKDFIVLVYWL